MERFFIHRSLLNDEYIGAVAIKETKTISSRKEKELKEQQPRIIMLPI